MLKFRDKVSSLGTCRGVKFIGQLSSIYDVTICLEMVTRKARTAAALRKRTAARDDFHCFHSQRRRSLHRTH